MPDDAGKVKIDSETVYGGGDSEIGYEHWPWHEEWLHYAREALGIEPPPPKEDTP